MSQWLYDLVQSKIVIFDGAMGTQLQERDFPTGECPEEWNLSHPDEIRAIHENYLKAGADVITTNTFGATAIRLEEYGLDDRVAEINHAAIRIAKEAVNNHGYGYVAASIGPTGKLIEPLGELPFDVAYDIYKEQVEAITDAGADLIIIETIGDINEMRAALMAAVEHSHLPVIASMSYQEDGRTFTGTDPESAAVVLERLGASIIAINCSVGPEQLEDVVKTLVRSTNLPILVQPNAGLPKLIQGKTVYEGSPEIMANYAKKFVEYGANLVGACCGSTPEYIQAISNQVKEMAPIIRTQTFGLRVASRVRTTEVNPIDGLPVIVGERINPTGRKKLSEELKQGKTEMVRREAIEQTEAGAGILDVNVGVPTIDEKTTMVNVIQSVQTLVDTPLMIDSTDPNVLDHALKLYPGKALVNSVNGEDESLDTILPLVKKYGAAIVGLTLDEKGIPKTAEERYQVAEKIIRKAESYGIPKQDVIIDCLVLTASAQPEGIAETLQAIRLVKERLQVSTILGVSNVSFGLPNRKAINPVFLSMALAAGLDAAIMNPLEEQMVTTMKIGGVLTNRDRHAEAYIEYAKEKIGTNEDRIIRKDQKHKEPKDLYEALYQVVLAGDKDRVVPLLEQGLQEGKDPMELLNRGLIPGIEEVGRLFGNGTYFLPQLIQAGDTMSTSFERLRPELAKKAEEPIATIVMATVKGDIHDIGKNIVSVLLSNHRFKVIDLGKNVPNEVVIQRAIEEKADIIGLSALMTTTMTRMREIVQMIEEQNLPMRVIVGGAAVNEQYAQEIGADGYAKDAVEAVELAKSLVKQRSVSE